MARQKRHPVFMSHDKYFNGKNLYILLAPRNIYQKQKKNQFNNYATFSETCIFFKFPDSNSKNDDVIKYLLPF